MPEAPAAPKSASSGPSARRPTTWSGKLVRGAYAAVYIAIVLLFAACAILLVLFSAHELFRGAFAAEESPLRERFEAVLEAVGMLTIAVASLELSQTVLEEEVQRNAVLSAPTRVRRFLSRFLVVVVVGLAIESLIAAFQFVHGDPGQMSYAALMAIGAAALLAAWGVFLRLNRSVETLEPEAMAHVKREDEKLADE